MLGFRHSMGGSMHLPHAPAGKGWGSSELPAPRFPVPAAAAPASAIVSC